MAEYLRVEKPFLDKLAKLGWQIVDQGNFGIPQDPAISLRTSFKEVTLKDEFLKALKHINIIDGKEWLTDNQLESLYQEITETERSNLSLLEANKQVFNKLVGHSKISRINELSANKKEESVKIIDFDNWDKNSFIAINQFRVITPGGPREGIIPDIVLFVNGLPLAVVECKDVDVVEPLSEAVDQLQRYANTRSDKFDTKEGEERLFHYNLFNIASYGCEARFGTISASFEYFLNWKDIFPEEYKDIEIKKCSEEEKTRYNSEINDFNPEVRQEVIIKGMFNKEIMLDVLRHFTLFLEIKEGVIVKIVSRYQQYRAAGKILNNLRQGKTPAERSGVVWHTQGSGKSLTMIFLIRKLRSQADLKDYKVIMMVDRKDLEKQLSDTAVHTNEFNKKKQIVTCRRELREKLAGDVSDLHMVMIHKLFHEEVKHSKALLKAFVEEHEVPEFKPFEVVNRSARILILIDEAHRSQGGEMGDNIFTAFPNAAKIAFTGTPLLTARHKAKTHERFGNREEFIDTYKIKEAVRDRATLDIIYQGKTSKDEITLEEAFDRGFEDEFKEASEEKKLEIQKRYGTMQAYLENEDRLKKIAADMVNHYIAEILPNGFKAMVVASSVYAAACYEKYILAEIKKRIKLEEESEVKTVFVKKSKDQEKGDENISLLSMLKILDAGTVVTKQDNNEDGFISAARKKAKELKVVDNFKKEFDFSCNDEGEFEKSETGMAFLCVCDRLLTGFDAPIAQVMYLDKNLKEHDLLQAIARVNRTKDTKKHGILVDYFGVSNNLKNALGIWGAEDDEDIKELLEFFRDINKEIPVLEARFNRMIQLFEDRGVTNFRAFITQKIADKKADFEVAEACLELAKEIPFRAQFDTYLKAFFDSLDLLFNTKQAKEYYIPAKRFGYLLVRIRNRYKDETLELKWAKAKVRKMIDKHLKTLGIESKIAPVELLSDDFPKEISKHNVTPKSKASEMEHAIRRHIKINMSKDPVQYTRFLERLNKAIERYKDNWDLQQEEFDNIRSEMAKGRETENEVGLDRHKAPFYDLIISELTANYKTSDELKEETKSVVESIIPLIKNKIDIPNIWGKESELKSLKGEIEEILLFSSNKEISSKNESLSNNLLQLAKNREREIIDFIDEGRDDRFRN